jgi:hypothetical protein
LNGPPGLSQTSAPWASQTEGGQPDSARAYLSVETLTRSARRVLADRGEEMSPSRLSKVIRRFVREGRADVDFRTWFIAYADPTGEAAVRNVMKGAGRG